MTSEESTGVESRNPYAEFSCEPILTAEEGKVFTQSFLFKPAYEDAKLSHSEKDDALTVTLKGRWSVIIGIILIAQVVFQLAFTTCVGFGWLDYTKYEWFIQIVLGGNFASIVMLASTILKYLFSDQSRPKT